MCASGARSKPSRSPGVGGALTNLELLKEIRDSLDRIGYTLKKLL